MSLAVVQDTCITPSLSKCHRWKRQGNNNLLCQVFTLKCLPPNINPCKIVIVYHVTRSNKSMESYEGGRLTMPCASPVHL